MAEGQLESTEVVADNKYGQLSADIVEKLKKYEIDYFREDKPVPFGKLNMFCILGTITANPNIPYNTDGIPANNSTAGDIIFATFFGATSAINTAVNIPIGTPIISAPTVAIIDATTIGPIPNLSLPGNQSLPIKKSIKEYPLNRNGVNPL